jgi:hypothetical protein
MKPDPAPAPSTSPNPGSSLARPETTIAVRRGATRLLRTAGFVTAAEMTFPSGRRADIVALKPNHDVWIVEVKSGLADFRADMKWSEYADYCDALCFAVPIGFPFELIPEPVGLIVADAFGGEMLRAPQRAPMAPARRKAVILAFAQLAAGRLMYLEDPDFRPGC